MRKKVKFAELRFYFVFLFIFCFMTIVYVNAAVKNYGMEGDEVFSYISSTSFGGYKGICFLDDQTWYEGTYFRDALIAEGEECFNYKMVVENQAMDTHPPFYYLLLNLVASVFSGQFSRWFGIGLNIFLMLFVWTGLYLILNRFLHRRYLAAFFSTVFCCSYLTFSLVLFIRMYILLMAIALFQTWYHLRLYEEVRKNRNFSFRYHWKSYVFLTVLTICGAWTHYYFIIYQCLISILFCVALLYRKQFVDILRYIGCMVLSASIYILIYPAALNHLFFKYRGREAVHKILEGNSLQGEAGEMLRSYNRDLYHGMLLWIAGGLLAVTVILLIRKKLRPTSIGKGILMLMPVGIYFLIISKASPFISLRYIAPVAPIIFAAVVVWAIRLIEVTKLKRREKQLVGGLMCLIFVFVCTYWWQRPIKYSFYAEKRDVIIELSELSDFCVYVTGDEYNWKMWEDYIYYPLFKGLYFIDGREMKPIEDLRMTAMENAVIFIDSALDQEEILDYLSKYLSCKHYEMVYSAQYNNIYFAT